MNNILAIATISKAIDLFIGVYDITMSRDSKTHEYSADGLAFDWIEIKV